MVLKTLNFLKITIKKLDNPIGLSCAFVCLAISWIAPIAFINESLNVKTDKRINTDIRITQKAWDSLYSPNTNYIEKNKLKGTKANLLSACKESTCNIYRGIPAMTQACKETLSTSKKFHDHRVYICGLVVSLDNDKPLDCQQLKWQVFDSFCKETVI